MAILNVKLPTNLTEYPNSFKRQGSFPLEAYSVFYAVTNAEGVVTTSALDAAKDYAKNNPIAYVGQILAVVTVTDGVSEVDVYKIENANGDLVPVGNTEEAEAAIQTLEAYIGEIPEDSDAKTIIEYINKKTEGIATDTALGELQSDVNTLEQIVGNAESGLVKDVADNKASIADIADKIGEVVEDKTLVEMIADAQDAATYDDTALQEQVTSNKNAIDKLNGDGTVEGSVDKKITDAINDFATKVSDNSTYDTFKELVDYVSEHGGEAAEMASAIQALETKVGEKSVTAQIEEAIAAENLGQYATDDELIAVSDRVEVLEGKSHSHDNMAVLNGITADKVSAWDEAEKNVIDSVDEAQFAVDADRKLTLLDVAISKVTGLQDALDAKANSGTTLADYGIVDAYTKEETLDKIAEKITEINGGESAGEVLSQLNSYKETNDTRVGNIETKLNGVEANAQVNDIELIKIAGSEAALPITDKTVEIPFASLGGAGVVKLSSEVGVDENNALEIKSVNVNKLIQTKGETLILNGGSSAI